jgi:16S rRNA (adenine1518-N6/adenine1519-N6)-dimethyltransferase
VSLAHLPPLREALAEHGLSAKKAFGQHFLLDLNLTRKIARLAGPFDGRVVIEVGPGPGGLTRALLEAGAQVIAVERDARFLPLLQELADAADGGLIVICADALKVDEAALIAEHAPGRPARIVANLPYNVGTPLLIKWLTGPFRPEAMTLMFQKEVADRIVAGPGGGAYGRLSVIAQAVCETQMLMDVPARAFTPPPKVDSRVVSLVPRADAPPALLLDALQTVTAAAFGQRRKMLRSSLKPLGGETLCRDAGVDSSARAETLNVKQFLTIAEMMLRAAPPAAPRQTA